MPNATLGGFVSRTLLGIAMAGVLASADLAHADPKLTATTVATGLTTPVYVTAPPGDPSRVFVVERSGAIRVVDTSTGTVAPVPFLSYTDVSTDTEQGLLGMAFSPNYAQNGLFYTYRSNLAGDIVVEGLQVSADPNLADPTSAQVVFTEPHQAVYHYGGWLGFGPLDGHLYISVGDGGDLTNAQNSSALYGKILRIDVNADGFPDDPAKNYAIPATNPFANGGGAGEVFAYGLRNPWRAGFDGQTGDLYVGDVGENTIEEIDLIPASSGGGQNFGWSLLEGDLPTGLGDPTGQDLVAPLHQYARDVGSSVTGGNVFRGDNIGGGLQGAYFFGDFISGKLWSLRVVDGQVTELEDRTLELAPLDGNPILNPAGFGEDGLGRIYIADFSSGGIFRIDAVPAAADPDRNGVVDLTDFGILKANFGTGTIWDQGDFNADGKVDLTDFGVLKANFGKDSGTAPAGVAAPEPGAAALACLAALGLLLGQLVRRR
jgi:glucose/arabinose dehydrogenase